MPEGCRVESGCAVNGCSPQPDPAEDEESSSVRPQSEHHTADTGEPKNLSTVTPCSPDSVFRDPEVLYDDVPAEGQQHQMEGESFLC